GPGTFFVRVRAENSAGVGAASNEVAITVGGGAPTPAGLPGRPGGLIATVNGTTVVFAWSAPAPGDGGAPPSYQIEAGSTSGAANPAITRRATPATSFSVGGVPPGTYYVRVRALNVYGAGAASNEVVVVVTAGGNPPPCVGPPSAPSGLAFAVAGSTVTLGWNDSAGATSYVVEAGSNPGTAELASFDTGSSASRLTVSNVG